MIPHLATKHYDEEERIAFYDCSRCSLTPGALFIIRLRLHIVILNKQTSISKLKVKLDRHRHFKWLVTFSSTFQDLEFDGSL